MVSVGDAQTFKANQFTIFRIDWRTVKDVAWEIAADPRPVTEDANSVELRSALERDWSRDFVFSRREEDHRARIDGGLNGCGVVSRAIPTSAKILDVLGLGQPIGHCPGRGSACGWESEACKRRIG
jgi:hypothetical protein